MEREAQLFQKKQQKDEFLKFVFSDNSIASGYLLHRADHQNSFCHKRVPRTLLIALYWMDIQYLYCVFMQYSREGVNMGFPSPATDYIEQRVTPASVCMTPDSRILETSAGYAIIVPVTRPQQGDALLILSGGRTQFAKLGGKR